MLNELLKFYNLTMILATITACLGGWLRNDQMVSAALAMITASGTSFQAQYKKGEDNTTSSPPPSLS